MLPNWFDMIDGTADIFPSRFDFEVTKDEALLLEQIQAACEEKRVHFDYMVALISIKEIKRRQVEKYIEKCHCKKPVNTEGKCNKCGYGYGGMPT
jgi:hypothetical protein